jgi:hypothetical protein
MNSEKNTMISIGLSLSALVVGSLIVGRTYFKDWQLRKLIVNKTNEINRMYDNCFTIDRLIDAHCIDGKRLSVGINSRNNSTNNILHRQGIRLGEDGNIKRLISFIKTDNGLVYEFEDDTTLTLMKNNKSNKITYSYKTPEITIVKEMDDLVVNMYKTIGVASYELDKIVELK